MPAARLILAGVRGSPGSAHALRYAADLARHHDAILVPLLTWVPPGGDLDERGHLSLQLRELGEERRLAAPVDGARHRIRRLPPGAHQAARAARQTRPGTCQRRPPGWRPAGHRNRAKGPAAMADRLPGEPLLPASRPMPGPGHAAPRASPKSRPWPSRLDVPSPQAGPRRSQHARQHQLAPDAHGARSTRPLPRRQPLTCRPPGPRRVGPIAWRPEDARTACSERLATSRADLLGARLSGIMLSRQGVPSCSVGASDGGRADAERR